MSEQDKLLIIDDQKIIRDSLATVLRGFGYHCLTAATVEQGKKLLHEHEFSLVLTDLRLENASGLDVIEFVNANFADTLVIVLTAYASLDTAISALRKGAYDYLIKPCNIDDLKHTVVRCLDKRRETLENKRLSLELERAYFLTIKALAAAVDAKDKYTWGHSDRVMQYSIGIGKTLQLDLDEIDDRKINTLRYAALIHDIGKIGIHDNILKKDGKLTPKEYSIIKLHPALGYDIIKDVDYLSEVRLFVRHHHEWYNGSGYPDGLKAEKIPLGAQIIAVADAYDAMTSDRTYRKALSHKDAVTELNKYKGQQFSNQVVDAFAKAYPHTPKLNNSQQFQLEFPSLPNNSI